MQTESQCQLNAVRSNLSNLWDMIQENGLQTSKLCNAAWDNEAFLSDTIVSTVALTA